MMSRITLNLRTTLTAVEQPSSFVVTPVSPKSNRFGGRQIRRQYELDDDEGGEEFVMDTFAISPVPVNNGHALSRKGVDDSDILVSILIFFLSPFPSFATRTTWFR